MRRLVNAIRRTLNGESPLNQELAVQLISRLARDARHSRAPATRPDISQQRDAVTVPREGLTTRELQILQILAQGKSNLQIAEELVISRGTVKVHVEHIISKLGVSDRTQAVVRAITLGLVNLRRS